MQLQLDLLNRSNKNDQPYYYQEIEDLIKIEESIEKFSRKSFDDNIEYYINKEIPDDFLVVDHDKKNLILFLNQLRSNPKKLSNGTQIIRSWLLGQTMEKSIPKEAENIALTPKELKIFFQGKADDIIRYREQKGIENDNVGCGWILYHYDAKLFSEYEMLKTLLNDHFSNVIADCNNYSVRLNYGIVSENHLRTDKRKMIKMVENLLSERGFDFNCPELFNDFSRSGEPVLLWIAKNHIGKTEYKAAVGINFGYDNGLSGYRLGLGLYFTDENLVSLVNKVAFKNKDNKNKAVNFAFKPWIHHKNFDYVEKKYKEFITEYFDEFYNNLVSILEKHKNKIINKNTFKQYNMNIHSKDYEFMKDEKEKIIDNALEKYGPNKYSQFMAWQEIAHRTSNENSRIKSLGHHIASCILGGQYGS